MEHTKKALAEQILEKHTNKRWVEPRLSELLNAMLEYGEKLAATNPSDAVEEAAGLLAWVRRNYDIDFAGILQVNIGAAHNHIVQFIEWYNNQKN
jgi:hypothetical protein